MLNEGFSLSKFIIKTMHEYPSFRFREKNKLIHNASDAGKCGRQLSYRALGYPQSNPADLLGELRMSFGSWLESGLKDNLLNKMGVFGAHLLSTQGDAGELDSFYGTSWHGYRDFDLGIKQADGKLLLVMAELKAKVGDGAKWTIIKNPYASKREYFVPSPPTDFGQAQQLALYLRDGYRKTKDNENFSKPIVDGILLQLLYADKLAGFVEYYAEYQPESDSVLYYRVVCDQYPEAAGPINFVINLRDIAEGWAKVDAAVTKGELALPDFERKYDVDDERVFTSKKTHLTDAIAGRKLIGDVQCSYCAWRDKCATDLGTPLEYDKDEVAKLKQMVKNH
jgi:hypothetical protein